MKIAYITVTQRNKAQQPEQIDARIVDYPTRFGDKQTETKRSGTLYAGIIESLHMPGLSSDERLAVQHTLARKDGCSFAGHSDNALARSLPAGQYPSED